MSFSSSKRGPAASQARLAAQIGTREALPLVGEHWIGGDTTDTDIFLGSKGNINSLQRYRYRDYFDNLREIYLDVCPNLLNTEEMLREVVQEEITNREKGCLSTGSSNRLQFLNARYWSLSQEWWRWRSALHPGTQLWGFELWRSHPRWYMHRDLVNDCVGRQGLTTRGILGIGHCTLECACCERARGFKVSDEEKQRLKELYKISLEDREEFRSRAIVRTSIWGITGGSWKDPFEVIDDAPPSYEEVRKLLLLLIYATIGINTMNLSYSIDISLLRIHMARKFGGRALDSNIICTVVTGGW
ncbi:unnamed protein product [Penicillium salamii]|uniref:Uncharacterized protein n=1 Tax=Penicillium salamii TaxID=1612424 RepID=A0A9W4JJX6_9EURO|nr:unnamed protein product [Penicillium salamii]